MEFAESCTYIQSLAGPNIVPSVAEVVTIGNKCELSGFISTRVHRGTSEVVEHKEVRLCPKHTSL